MGHEIVGPKSRKLYYRAGTSIKSIALDTLEVRHICDLPSDLSLYHYTLSSDERTLASGYYDGGRDIAALPRAQVFVKMFEAHLRNVIYTIDIETGHYEEVHEEGNWLGHFQFSPTDPNTLMFCHEGPWARLDRIWLLDLTERDARLVYRREREGEIAGHEFWHPDGTCVWFDLRYPPQAEFYLASTDIVTGETARYPLRPEEWSVHYNVDRQGRRICGDGGGLGPWIYLYEPRADATVSVSKLCSLAGHDYARWEPNVHFSPDGKWVTFAANMHGENRVYAVGASAEED